MDSPPYSLNDGPRTPTPHPDFLADMAAFQQLSGTIARTSCWTNEQPVHDLFI
jgi:hypothetical protein